MKEIHFRYIKHSKGVYLIEYKVRRKWKTLFKYEIYGIKVEVIGSKKECLQALLQDQNVYNYRLFQHPTIKVINPQ